MIEDFMENKVPVEDELQIYTWHDATLKELAECVRREVEAARKKNAELQFSFVYPDFNGKYRRKDVGSVFQGQRNPEYMMTLQQLRFVIGDYIDLAIIERAEANDRNYEGRGGNRDDHPRDE